jgi:hypothetical protein
MSVDLRSIDITDGVNDKGEPFCTVAATSADGGIFIGQLSPTEVRAHAMAYLEVAEAAEQDAATWRVIRKLGLPEPEKLASLIIRELRDSRHD